MGFLQGGGFARVLQVLMAAPTGGEENRDAVLGHASALRILKLCLFFPPLGGVGVGGGDGGGSRLAAGRAGDGGRGQGGGSGGGSEEVLLLVNRAMPPVAQPTPPARAAMKVSESDLQQLLDKLVLVRCIGRSDSPVDGGTVRGVNEESRVDFRVSFTVVR